MKRGNWPFFSLVPLTMASMMLGWSEPRLTKTWVTPASHSDSKKAKDVVYILPNSVSDVVVETYLLSRGLLSVVVTSGIDDAPVNDLICWCIRLLLYGEGGDDKGCGSVGRFIALGVKLG